MKSEKGRINIRSTIFIIILIIITIIIYKKYDYNFYFKGVAETGKTSFSRDSEETTNNKRSYKIENKDYNDAMFYREISVKENTPYKVTCMVKTEDVEKYNDVTIAGAQIVLKGTEEHSYVVSGTTDWTKLEFCFNSKNNTEIEIGFRLGGNGEKAKGTAWFSEITLEEGALESDNTWNFAYFIIDNVNVELDNGKTIYETLTRAEVYELNDTIGRVKNSLAQMSKNKIQVDYDMIEITDSIKTLTYDETNGYYISEKDVYNLIKDYTMSKEYDHIFICAKLPNQEDIGIDAVNWVGLGNMEFCGKGFSNIRVSDTTTSSGLYKYSSVNNFPEEVFIHEFLHTLERNAEEYGYEIPALHDNAEYGYEETRVNGLKIWYTDYMNKSIISNGGYIGLPEEIYTYKPVQLSNFEYSYELDELAEPDDPAEIIKSVVSKITNLFKKKNITSEVKGVSE